MTLTELKEQHGDAFYHEESDFFARSERHKPVIILAREWVNNALIVVWRFK